MHSFVGTGKRRLALLGGVISVVGVSLLVSHDVTSPRLADISLYHNGVPVDQTSAPVLTPPPYPVATFSNSVIRADLSSGGFNTYAPPSTNSSPALDASRADSIAATEN